MRTLIVLCAGGKTINNQPVYLNRHPDGKLFAEKSIENIYVENYDKIVFTVLERECIQYNAKEVLINELGGKYNICIAVLKNPTSGPAESVYLTIGQMRIEGAFAVRDSLNAIKITNDIRGNFIAGLDLIKYTDEVYNIKSKSFIVTNEQHQILDVVEKRFRSDIISVGLYGFKKVDDFLLAYKKLCDLNYPIGKLYLSNIISYLIGYKARVYHCVNVYYHEDWGSIETWNRIQKKYATIFIDTDKLLKQDYSDSLANDLLDNLKCLSGKSVSIVLFTRTKNINKKVLYDLLDAKKINCIDFICNVSYSVEQLMISDSDSIKNISLGV